MMRRAGLSKQNMHNRICTFSSSAFLLIHNSMPNTSVEFLWLFRAIWRRSHKQDLAPDIKIFPSLCSPFCRPPNSFSNWSLFENKCSANIQPRVIPNYLRPWNQFEKHSWPADGNNGPTILRGGGLRNPNKPGSTEPKQVVKLVWLG